MNTTPESQTPRIHRAAGNLSPWTWAAIVIVVIGALNWGLVGLFRYDLVAALFGQLSTASRIIYVVVALAGLYLLGLSFARLRQIPRPLASPG